MHIRTHLCIWAYRCICICTYLCVYTYVYVCAYRYMHIWMHMHIDSHTYNNIDIGQRILYQVVFVCVYFSHIPLRICINIYIHICCCSCVTMYICIAISMQVPAEGGSPLLGKLPACSCLKCSRAALITHPPWHDLLGDHTWGNQEPMLPDVQTT